MILVVGSTGLLGGMIARSLLEQGLSVRILVRPGSSYAGLVEMGAEPAFGDLKEPHSLTAACRAVDTVITTANSALRGRGDTIESVDRRGNQNLIDAAKAAGVRHFIFVSALGVSEQSPVDMLRAKAETERYLRDSGMEYTILQPNVFLDVWIPLLIGTAVEAGQPVTLVGEGRRRHSMIAVADVAAFTVATVSNPTAINRTILLGGPEPVSWRDIVAACERALGHSLEVRWVAPGEPIPGLPEIVGPLAATLETYDSPLDMTGTAAAFRVRPTSLEECATKVFLYVRDPLMHP
jgi:uncharacterized protein YbjT (DUF2867 family)